MEMPAWFIALGYWLNDWYEYLAGDLVELGGEG